MNQAKATTDEVFSWVEAALEKNLSQYVISLDGTSDKCDGYIGEIVFVKVTLTGNEERVLHLVVKHSKQNEHLRASAFKLMFDAEIHFYDRVLPALNKFQLEKNSVPVFDAAPKCLKTILLRNKEVLVFENLKVRGYQLHDRKKPLNYSHMEAVLKQFGRFHALSFALRDQNQSLFESLLEEYPDFMGTFLTDTRTKNCFGIAIRNALKVLEDHHEFELVDKFNKLLGSRDPAEVMAELVRESDARSVIVHGDGWSNNFMFKYHSSKGECPTSVVILDWQVSQLRSPAIDLAYFFYSTASSKELDRFDELLGVYYASFSKSLKILGSDPESLFPFAELLRHWERYSTYGVLFAAFLLTFVLCDQETAPAFEDLKDEASFRDILIVDASRNGLFFERFRDVARHYFQNRDKRN